MRGDTRRRGPLQFFPPPDVPIAEERREPAASNLAAWRRGRLGSCRPSTLGSSQCAVPWAETHSRARCLRERTSLASVHITGFLPRRASRPAPALPPTSPPTTAVRGSGSRETRCTQNGPRADVDRRLTRIRAVARPWGISLFRLCSVQTAASLAWTWALSQVLACFLGAASHWHSWTSRGVPTSASMVHTSLAQSLPLP